MYIYIYIYILFIYIHIYTYIYNKYITLKVIIDLENIHVPVYIQYRVYDHRIQIQ